VGEEAQAKLRLVEDYCMTHGLSLEQCLVVGDSRNDIPLFSATGNGIAFSWSDEVVRAHARFLINTLAEIPALVAGNHGIRYIFSV
jgi:phosphoserine phosphatase